MTLAFVAVMTIVLGAIGVFVYLRFGAELDHATNNGLRSRAGDVAALFKEVDSGLSERRPSKLAGQAENFAEVLGENGTVLDATRQLRGHVLLSQAELRRAEHSPVLLERRAVPGLRGAARLLATPLHTSTQHRVVVVGTSTGPLNDSRGDLLQLLLLGGPIALLLASLAAYGVAAAALRPVEAMRARAAEISAAAPDRRLPVPPSGDEIARLGTTLNAMLQRLGEALAHERRFVADASHELRTPLAILKTELELALARGRTREELQAALESAAEETDRLTQLAEDLLVLAQTDEGSLAVTLQETDVGVLMEDVRSRFARRAGESGRVLEVSVAESVRVRLDRLRVEQALGNLVDNALRYGGGSVTLTADVHNGSIELHVVDRGRGFSEEFAERAFERFSRAETSHGKPGSGLGMAIVDSIARAHEGSAGLANRTGGGADVWLVLPTTLM
ncbi:MAG TPA: HAMP domain-containing sensor histidine kinase [Solirubrobacteraceae bacterium]|nr:HAMP domain-containing sensor histidine kinase [Solirubrobacteraceae bacterium]